MILLASTSRRGAMSVVDVGERDLLDRHVLSPRCSTARGRALDEIEREEQVRVLVAEAGRVEELGQLARADRPRSRSPPRARGRRCVSGASPSTSRLPAGTSSSSRARGDAVLAHERRAVADRRSTGTTTTAPGWRTTMRSRLLAVGRLDRELVDRRGTRPSRRVAELDDRGNRVARAATGHAMSATGSLDREREPRRAAFGPVTCSPRRTPRTAGAGGRAGS